MTKNNKAARKLVNHEPDQPAPAYEKVDYGNPQTSDEEGETKEDSVVAESKEDGAVADSDNTEVTSPSAAREPSSQALPSPAPSEENVGLSLEDMSPQQLQLLLFKEEAAARIIAFREQRTAPSLSAGSSQLAVQLAQHNQNPVRADCPIDSAGLALSDLSISVDQPVAHAYSVVTAAGQDGGESKESSSTTPNPRPSSLPSVTQPNPSLEA